MINPRLTRVGILGKEREPGVGNLGWHGNFDAEFERNIILFHSGHLYFLNDEESAGKINDAHRRQVTAAILENIRGLL